jgi:hypothetical protein
MQIKTQQPISTQTRPGAEHPSPPKLTNALMRDLLNPSVSTLDLCDYHNLPLSALIEIINSPDFKQLQSAFEQINAARTQLVNYEASFTTKASLNDITRQRPESEKHTETIRKSATKLSTKLSTPTINQDQPATNRPTPAQQRVPKRTKRYPDSSLKQTPIPINLTNHIVSPKRKPTREGFHMYKFITPLAFTAALTSALSATTASATLVETPDPFMYTDPLTGQLMCGFTLDIAGFQSIGFQGDPLNETLEVFIGAQVEITGVSWDINLTTFGLSWADEPTIGFQNQAFINPGQGDAFTVENMNYTSDGIVPLSETIVLGVDGILNLEFFEVGFDDNPGMPDALYENGSTITIHSIFWPTPSATTTLAFAGLICSRRRRTKP